VAWGLRPESLIGRVAPIGESSSKDEALAAEGRSKSHPKKSFESRGKAEKGAARPEAEVGIGRGEVVGSPIARMRPQRPKRQPEGRKEGP